MLKYIADPLCCASFQRFLRSQFCEETLLFYLSVEKYRTEPDDGLMEASMALFMEFISHAGDHVVNISSETVQAIKERVQDKDFSRDLYDEAQGEVLRLMGDNAWIEFKHSLFYRSPRESSSADTSSDDYLTPKSDEKRSSFSSSPTSTEFRFFERGSHSRAAIEKDNNNNNNSMTMTTTTTTSRRKDLKTKELLLLEKERVKDSKEEKEKPKDKEEKEKSKDKEEKEKSKDKEEKEKPKDSREENEKTKEKEVKEQHNDEKEQPRRASMDGSKKGKHWIMERILIHKQGKDDLNNGGGPQQDSSPSPKHSPKQEKPSSARHSPKDRGMSNNNNNNPIALEQQQQQPESTRNVSPPKERKPLKDSHPSFKESHAEKRKKK
jgi:hypothetical protein